MKISFHKKFIKKYKKVPPLIKAKFKERRNLFLHNPFHPLLNNHPLYGEYAGHRSINITGDWRLIFKALDKDEVLFYEIDTHAELYGT